MIENLSNQNLIITYNTLQKIIKMPEEDLDSYRDEGSISLCSGDLKEVILEALDARIGRSDRIAFAVVEGGEINTGEIDG